VFVALMTIHFALLVNRQGALVASRFYDGSPSAARLEWQQAVYQAIGQTFSGTRDGVQLAMIKYWKIIGFL